VVDIFDEVEEQERARRWRELARKFLPWLIGAAVAALAVFGGWYGWRSWQAAETAKSSEAYSRGLEALGRGDTAAAETAFTAASETGSAGYRSLALQMRAGLFVERGNTAEAVALLDEAAKLSRNPLVSDAAGLKAALLVLDTAPYADVEERLRPLMEEGRPFRESAREALAIAKLAAGRAKEAREDFVVLGSALDAPEGLRQRAQAAVQAIDSGTALRAPAIAKAAAALPAGAAGASDPFNTQPGPAAPGAGAAQ
jgi:hypothetical protein